jgi:hypothetical protein
MKLTTATKIFVKNSYIEFHKNLANCFVTDTTSRTDGRTWPPHQELSFVSQIRPEKLFPHRYQVTFLFVYYFCRTKCKRYNFNFLLLCHTSDTYYNAFQQLSFSHVRLFFPPSYLRIQWKELSLHYSSGPPLALLLITVFGSVAKNYRSFLSMILWCRYL